MSVGVIAAWRQMDNWFKSQGAMNQQLLGGNNSASSDLASAETSSLQNADSLLASAASASAENNGQTPGASLQSLVNSSSTGDITTAGAAASAFASAQTSYFTNMANLAANEALTRVQNESQTASAQLQTLISNLGTTDSTDTGTTVDTVA